MMKRAFLLLVVIIVALQSVQTQPVNYYPAATIATAGGNATVVPYSTPGYSESITATTSTNFKGLLHVEKQTGAVLITNAHPAGNYIITVRFFHGGGSITTTTFSLTVNTYTACNGGSFANAANATSGTTPFAIAVSDFNNDGRQDLVTANSGNNTASIKLGDGLGGFLQAALVSTGNTPVSVAVSDFNGDGKQDIAVANRTSNSVSIRLGDGTGGFAGTTEVPVGNNPQSVITGNFNNDGIADLAIANANSNTVSIRLGNGMGGFTGTTEVPVGNNPYSVAAADFNNDNNEDIATANFTSNTVSVRLGNGTGGFGNTNEYSIGVGPRSIITGDFNGDNNPDFAVLCNANDTTGASNSINIRYANGAGVFYTNMSFTIAGGGRMPATITSGDFNSDGKADLAVANTASASVSILFANASNNFISITSRIPVSTKPYGIAVGDFNQDGRQDLATADTAGAGNISIRLSDNNEINVQGNNINIADGDVLPDTADNTDFGNVSFIDTVSFVVRNSGPANLYIRTITLTGADNAMFRVIGSLFNTVIPPGISAGFSVRFLPTSAGLKKATVTVISDDCDEGNYDFVVQGTGVAVTPTLGLYAGVTIAAAGGNATVTPTAPPTSIFGTTASTTADFKGLLHVDSATGTVTITNAHPAGTYPITVKAYNGIVTTTTSFNLIVNNPQCSNSRFSQGAVITTSGSPQSVVVSDFNNDGYQDLASVNVTSNTVSINYGNGTGAFGGTATLPTGPSPFSISSGDFNGDGQQDFITANTGTSLLSVWLGNRNGGFRTAAFNAGAQLSPYAAITGDFNGDGKLDLAVANSGSNNVTTRLGDGEGSFGVSTNVAVGSFPYTIVKGDFNGDGNLDFATANFNSTTVSIRLGNGTGAFTVAPDVTTGSKPITLAVGDFNSDGRQDLAVANSNANTISVCYGNGTGGFNPATNLNVESSPASIALGDFNGDGKQDIATGLMNNTVSIFSGDGAGNFIYKGKVNVAGPARALAIGDFNGDGRQDFASGNAVANTISIHLGGDKEINVQGNNTSIASGNNVPDTTHHTDFGLVNNGSTVTRTFTIQNTGTDTLRVGSITITGSDSLSFTRSSTTLPTIVLPGNSLSFTVTFTSAGNGLKAARINVLNDDCDESVYSFAIRGVAVCTPLSVTNIWLGNTANWNLASNWSQNFVPTECTKVVVNIGVPFMPEIISPNSTCYSLALNNGATITVKTGGHLNITANN